jgi:hypothetical protein
MGHITICVANHIPHATARHGGYTRAMTRHRLTVVAASALLVGARLPEAGPPSIVVIAVDTLCADHLGHSGYQRPGIAVPADLVTLDEALKGSGSNST